MQSSQQSNPSRLSRSNKRGWSRSNKRGVHALALLGVLILLIAGFLYVNGVPYLSDESFNFRQISRFRQGDFSMEPLMNVIPGYHAAVALVLWATGRTGLFSARLVSTLISAVTVLVCYLLAWRVEGRSALVRTLQFAFFPIIFPFFSLVYMDILALMLVLLGFYLVLCKRYTLAGVAGILSVLARTNNIIWLAFLFVYMLYEEYGFDWRKPFQREGFSVFLRLTWVFWIGFALFGVFLFLNQGIAIGDKSVQPLFKFEAGNIYFLLFLFLPLFLPFVLANVKRIGQLFMQKKWVLVILLLLFAVFLLSYHNTHPYNNVRPDYYVRNALLMAADQRFSWKLVLFIPVALSVLALGVTRLQQRSFYWLYPFTLLSLIPFWLVEPRYYFVPYSLFILMQERRSPRLEWLAVGYNLVLALILLYLTRNQVLFI
jgi:alpha-1,2-glucosyltransferase